MPSPYHVCMYSVSEFPIISLYAVLEEGISRGYKIPTQVKMILRPWSEDISGKIIENSAPIKYEGCFVIGNLLQ